MAHLAVPPDLTQLKQLHPHDTEFGYVEYLLKLALRSATVEVQSMHILNGPQKTDIFANQFSNSTVLDSFVNVRELNESDVNTLRHVIQRGGRFVFTPDEPHRMFPVGNMRLPTDLRDISDGNVRRRQEIHEFLFCKVACGHALVLERSKLPSYERGIPQGYDSIKVHTTEEEEDPGATTDPHYYYHEYFLSDSARILPLFVVRFLFDPDADRLKRNPLCENCERNPASLYCLDDNAKLCDQCDLEVHRQSRILQKHSRVSLSDIQSSIPMARCREHQDMPVQYVDQATYQPVCYHCMLVGDHSGSGGGTREEGLVPIHQAYSSSMQQLQRQRSIIDVKKDKLNAQLQHIDERLHAIHTNASQVEAQLNEIMKRACNKLHEQTQQKLHLLLSDEVELKRQLHYFEWLDAFLKYQKDIVNPVEFMIAFKHHAQVLADTPYEELETSAIVLTDFKVVGDLDVTPYRIDHQMAQLGAEYMSGFQNTASPMDTSMTPQWR